MENNLNFKLTSPQIKICGLTRPDEAVKCALLGADAIGMVFFKNSPRYITPLKAKAVCKALPEGITAVGVFVNEPFESLMDIVSTCNLAAVQLHGNEPPKFVTSLMDQGLIVIKALYMESKPSVDQVASYNASAYLVECEKGILPGGNAISWNWQDARDFGEKHPLILAGGLTPDNVHTAIADSCPDAVDISSGVESAPGKKDIYKVKKFIKAVHGCKPDRELRRIF